MMDAARKRTICARKYYGFRDRTRQRNHCNVQPKHLAQLGGKPKIEAGDFDLTLVTDAEELLLAQECNIDDVKNMIAITNCDLLGQEK